MRGALTDNYRIPGTNSQAAYDLLTNHFPEMSGADARVVVQRRRWAHRRRRRPRRRGDRAARRRQGRGGVSCGHQSRRALIPVQYAVPVTGLVGDEGVRGLTETTTPLGTAGYQVAFGGSGPENVQSPGGTAELVGVGAALLMLLLAFG